MQMAYHLRSRPIGKQLKEQDEECDGFDDVATDDEIDHVSEFSASDSDSSGSDYSDAENATLSQRLLESRARGRPSTKLRGKEKKYVWDTRPPQRTSSKNCEIFCPPK